MAVVVKARLAERQLRRLWSTLYKFKKKKNNNNNNTVTDVKMTNASVVLNGRVYSFGSTFRSGSIATWRICLRCCVCP